MHEETVTVPPSDGYPLFMCAKRYWVDSSPTEGFTLILLHATSFHKETWEPTLERVFRDDMQGQRIIREAWAIDCPNHGVAGAFNERTLLQPEYFLNFSCEKFMLGVYHFLASSHTPDFADRALIGIGHSLGGNAMALLQTHIPQITFKSLIIIEPMCSAAGAHQLAKLRTLLIKGAYERRDVWPDRATARTSLEKRERTKRWDTRVLDAFVKYGIRTHPGAFYVECPYPGVTLACTREQEAAMYRDPSGATTPVTALDVVLARGHTPVHVVLGGIYDFMPKRTHAALLYGRTFASASIVEKAGHLIVQEYPDVLGDVIYSAVSGGLGEIVGVRKVGMKEEIKIKL